MFAILFLWSCKPTERNYQLAYDKAAEAARLKREAETTGADGRRLESINGPRKEVVAGDTIMVASEVVKALDDKSADNVKGKIGIAVAKFRMATNAKSNVSDLKSKYPQALVATNGKDAYYVVVECVSKLDEAGIPIKAFMTKNPNFHYMGLSGEPALVHFSR